jgi:transposase
MSDRKYFSPEEKMRIVLEGLSGTIQVSELCRKYGISAVNFYNWKEKLLKESPSIFDNRGRKNTRREREMDDLRTENQRLKDAIAEITTENLQLKKKIGNRGVRI